MHSDSSRVWLGDPDPADAAAGAAAEELHALVIRLLPEPWDAQALRDPEPRAGPRGIAETGAPVTAMAAGSDPAPVERGRPPASGRAMRQPPRLSPATGAPAGLGRGRK